MPSLMEETCSDAAKLAHEIHSDVMASEDEIAEAIQAGFDYRDQARDRRATDVLAWALDTFGPVAGQIEERALRLIEEAVELVHAAGLEADAVQRIIGRVYSRPAGSVPKEVGQVGLTLEAFAAVYDVSAETETEREWKRIQAIPQEEWTRRHEAKKALGIAC